MGRGEEGSFDSLDGLWWATASTWERQRGSSRRRNAGLRELVGDSKEAGGSMRCDGSRAKQLSLDWTWDCVGGDQLSAGRAVSASRGDGWPLIPPVVLLSPAREIAKELG
jgi:hypothetical protein